MSIFTNNLASAKEEAAAYTAATIQLVEGREPLDVLRTTPDLLRQMIAGVHAARLTRPEAPGKWSVQQVLAHLADSELIVGWRIRLIMASDAPPITGVDQDQWASSLRYENIAPELALDTFAALRRWNLQVIEPATEQELQRYGVHSERGRESLAHIIRLYAGHDILHQRQISRILGSQG